SAGPDMLRLISGMLGFAQLGSGALAVRAEPLDLSDVLTRAESLLRVRFEETGMTYSRRSCAPGVAVLADPDRLQQVLLNLLTNALKFTPPGGEISMSCERDGDIVRIHV